MNRVGQSVGRLAVGLLLMLVAVIVWAALVVSWSHTASRATPPVYSAAGGQAR